MALTPLRTEQLRNRVEIMRQTGAAWAQVSRPWAEVHGQDGGEAVIGQALQGISTYRLRVWWRSDLLPSDQVRLGGAGGIDLNILSIADPFGTRRELMLIASTGSALPTS